MNVNIEIDFLDFLKRVEYIPGR